MGDVMSELLLERGIVALPWKVGDVFMKEQLHNRPAIDYHESKKAGKRVYHSNAHSDFKIYSAYWLSPERQHKKRNSWCFSLYRGTGRMVTKLLKGGKKYPNYKLLNSRTTKKPKQN